MIPVVADALLRLQGVELKSTDIPSTPVIRTAKRKLTFLRKVRSAPPLLPCRRRSTARAPRTASSWSKATTIPWPWARWPRSSWSSTRASARPKCKCRAASPRTALPGWRRRGAWTTWRRCTSGKDRGGQSGPHRAWSSRVTTIAVGASGLEQPRGQLQGQCRGRGRGKVRTIRAPREGPGEPSARTRGRGERRGEGGRWRRRRGGGMWRRRGKTRRWKRGRTEGGKEARKEMQVQEPPVNVLLCLTWLRKKSIL